MLKKILPILLVLILLLSGCGKQPQPSLHTTDAPLNAEMLDDILGGMLFVDGEDDMILPTDEEVIAVTEQLKADFALMQEVEVDPEKAQLTLWMDTADKKRLEIAVFDGEAALLLAYIKNTDNDTDKDYFSLQSAELREKIDAIYARILYLRDNPKGKKEILTFLGENTNWQAILTVENTYYEKAEDNPRGYEQEEDGTFVLHYKGTSLENVDRFNFRYLTDYRNEGVDNARLDGEGKITTYIKSSNQELFREDSEISVWVELDGEREKFNMRLVK